MCVSVCVWRIARSDPGASNPIGGVRVEAGEDYGIREGKMRHEMATLQLHCHACWHLSELPQQREVAQG